jgi:hypothetical protein
MNRLHTRNSDRSDPDQTAASRRARAASASRALATYPLPIPYWHRADPYWHAGAAGMALGALALWLT